jgi:hypothetical protein
MAARKRSEPAQVRTSTSKTLFRRSAHRIQREPALVARFFRACGAAGVSRVRVPST